MQGAETVLGDRVIFANDQKDALAEADVAVVTTPWPQFKNGSLVVRPPSAPKLVIIDPWRVVAAEGLPANVSLVRMGYGGQPWPPSEAVVLRRASV